MSDQLIEVARSAIRVHLSKDRRPRKPGLASSSLPWGVFVSLHSPSIDGHEGSLRGCIGSLNLIGVSLEEEVGRVAVSSATADSRFPPLRVGEIEDLEITIYLLDPPERVDSPADLDPQAYGIIVKGPGGRNALLLPSLPGIDTATNQMDAAMRKAQLKPGDNITIERFSAEIIH